MSATIETLRLNWRKYLTSIISIGCSSRLSDDANRRMCIINLFTLFGIVLTLSFAINSYRQHSTYMAFCLAGVCILLATARMLVRPEKRIEHQLMPASLLIISMTVLMTILIVTGGIDNTGPLWIFILPPLALFFAGHKFGLILMGAFVLFISVLLFYPNEQFLATSYSFEFKLRLILSFSTTILFSAVFEYTRQQYFKRIQDLNDKNNYLALHDQLTALPNRRYVQNYLSREIAHAKRSSTSIALMLCDIDKFKRINDEYGHDCGDKVLVDTAKIFLDSVREQDLVARWGGEEFLFVLPETEIANAESLANLIREKLAQRIFTTLPETERVTASFGITCVDINTSIDHALFRADKALYEAKRSGRNRAIVYHESMG